MNAKVCSCCSSDGHTTNATDRKNEYKAGWLSIVAKFGTAMSEETIPRNAASGYGSFAAPEHERAIMLRRRKK